MTAVVIVGNQLAVLYALGADGELSDKEIAFMSELLSRDFSGGGLARLTARFVYVFEDLSYLPLALDRSDLVRSLVEGARTFPSAGGCVPDRALFLRRPFTDLSDLASVLAVDGRTADGIG